MILILGGTGEARALAAALDGRCVTSLAGAVSNPRLPVGEVRIGGFGGVEGLAEYLSGVDAVVDATHPFAQQISANAAAACERTGTPLLRLERPGFTPRPGWIWVDDLSAAAAHTHGQRAFLTTGRQGLEAFAPIHDAWFLIRCVDPPGDPLPRHHELILDRGPYSVESERALMERHNITMLVTKDSGGAMTQAKLDAAGERTVVVVRRPPRPGVETVTSVEAAVHRLGYRRGV
ncbi:MAG: cobalt-precorrin-6A reductase [Solirubrobacterales bacterium]|nr:cobalt-precorrin-6A reductase [Solirubrobacterales bacterium]